MILLLISFWIFTAIAYLAPKEMKRIEMYMSSWFTLYIALVADTILGGKYKLYAYFKPGVHYIDFLAAMVTYPAINILFISLFPFKSDVYPRLDSVSLGYEWFAANHSEMFNYTGWKTIYSIPIYPTLYVILLLNFFLMRKLFLSPGCIHRKRFFSRSKSTAHSSSHYIGHL
ncbi:hypothetical protein ACJROX_05390 [Pseudalkalibacillus sp. A8]|uniref:hypothetical protein n=1 Tax=Pseudalkalibacillus sp. A8 TaxID=3382641 RepID=UPI0038B4F5FA